MRHCAASLTGSAATVLGLTAALIGFGMDRSAAQEAPAELVEAAQDEGIVVLYSANPVPGTEHLAEAFEEKYGITVERLALPAGTLMQRFASELDAGSFNADIIVGAGFDGLVTNEYIPNGWMIPIQEAGIPALEADEYPEGFLNESTATLAYNPWLIAYNTDLVDESDLPDSFEDLADPKYKDMVCIPNPQVAVAYIEVWDRMRESFGPEMLEGVGANNPKLYESAAAASSALGAGECAIAGPVTAVAVAALPDRAPVDQVLPEVTTGTQMELGYLDPEKIAHPNAARLFAQYLLTPEGNEQQATVGGNIWVLDPSMSMEQIAALKAAPDAADRTDEILGLLGVK